MSTSEFSGSLTENIPSSGGLRFGVVVSEWNSKITGKLAEGALETLSRQGAHPEDITLVHVPGSFELPSAARWLAEKGNFDAVILLGCVIRGDTSHFDYVCQGVTQGTMALNLQFPIPFIFGVLTTENEQQAIDRAGGKLGNKGEEAAITAIRMALLMKTK